MGAKDRKQRDTDVDQPLGVLGLVGRFARQLPGADFAEEQLHNIETRAMRELKQRLESVDDRRLPPPDDYLSTGQKPQLSTARPPAALMAELLGRSNAQSEQEALAYFYSSILRQLVPDEARLLATLADGGSHPVLHIGIGPPIGTPRRVVENFSHLGKTAALRLRDFTPAYLSRLHSLELVEEGPEDKEQTLKYQILESEKIVREAAQLAEKGKTTGTGLRFIRRVVRISPQGRALWGACQSPQTDKD